MVKRWPVKDSKFLGNQSATHSCNPSILVYSTLSTTSSSRASNSRDVEQVDVRSDSKFESLFIHSTAIGYSEY
jgi:hypothetical protein